MHQRRRTQKQAACVFASMWCWVCELRVWAKAYSEISASQGVWAQSVILNVSELRKIRNNYFWSLLHDIENVMCLNRPIMCVLKDIIETVICGVFSLNVYSWFLAPPSNHDWKNLLGWLMASIKWKQASHIPLPLSFSKHLPPARTVAMATW